MSRFSVQKVRSTTRPGNLLQIVEAGTKRRLSDAEVRDLDFRECKFNVLLRISSVYVNAGTYGPVATPEAIVVKREDLFPEALDDCCDQLTGLEMG